LFTKSTAEGFTEQKDLLKISAGIMFFEMSTFVEERFPSIVLLYHQM
jgi:hypothetical protein